MDKESLVKRRDDVEAKFEQQTTTREDTSQELLRLQGEYRLLTELINNLEEDKSAEEEKPGNG